MKYDYLILGGGVSGHRAAEEVRKLDSVGSIAIVTDEKYRLYSRVLLPHFLSGKIPREKVFLVKPEWYAEHAIDYLPGKNILRVDAESKVVELSGGEVIGYKKMLLATGCHARKTEITGTVALNFRNLDDADRIAIELAKLEALPIEKRIVGVYGAGFIAVEFINLFAARGCRIHIFYRGERFWARQLDEKSSALLEARLVAGNCVLHPRSELKDVQEFASQLVCLGIGLGVIPQNSFAVSDSTDIWTAGDVTGSGTWQSADMQGRLVGKNMVAGTHEIFKLIPSQAINVIDVPVTMIGDAHPEKAEKVEISEALGGVIQKMYRDQKLVGVTLVGTARERAELKSEIENFA
ncbi:MAG: FAD/NAD(P)-binding oxidoreductase [bacterium]